MLTMFLVTLSCRIPPPGLLLGLVMEFPPLNSALGFFFYPPLVIILPLVFSSSHPWLLFSLLLFRFLATIQPLVFHFYPPLAIILPCACIQQVIVYEKGLNSLLLLRASFWSLAFCDTCSVPDSRDDNALFASINPTTFSVDPFIFIKLKWKNTNAPLWMQIV